MIRLYGLNLSSLGKDPFTRNRGWRGTLKASARWTDASVESRRGRISSFFLAPLPGKRKSRKKQTNPKGQNKKQSSPDPNIQSNPNDII